MKKIFLILCLSIVLFAKEGSSARGQTYYQFIIKPILGFNGDVFAKKYTQKQWKSIFLHEGKLLKMIFSNEEFNTFLKSKKFLDIQYDLKAFALEYARDTGSVASCEE